MSKPIALGAAGILLCAAALAAGYFAGARSDATAAVQTTQGANRGEVERIVRDYMLANPELLNEMQAALDLREREEQEATRLQAITSASADLFDAAHDGVIGNPDGDVTIVEFFDYNCGFCKRALEDMEALVAADPKLRFVLKEFPILGPDSQRAHVVSMAFQKLAPDRYHEFHRALMTGGRATEEAAVAAALAQGVDEAELREAMENPEIEQAFANTYALAGLLSITGTPSYVVGTEVVFGALGEAVLREKIELARAAD